MGMTLKKRRALFEALSAKNFLEVSATEHGREVYWGVDGVRRFRDG
jgi:hypothetical protein